MVSPLTFDLWVGSDRTGLPQQRMRGTKEKLQPHRTSAPRPNIWLRLAIAAAAMLSGSNTRVGGDILLTDAYLKSKAESSMAEFEHVVLDVQDPNY